MECSRTIRVATTFSPQRGLYLSVLEKKFCALVLEALRKPYEWVPFKEHRASSGGNRTDPVDMIRNGEADLSFHLLSMTESRDSVVDFIPVYMTDDQTFAIKKVPLSLDFVQLFDFPTWILTLSALLAMPFIFRFLLNTKYTYLHSLIEFFGCVLGQSMRAEKNSLKYTIMVSSWSCFSKLLVICYSAALFSVLAVPLQHPNVRNFEELSDAVTKENYKCFIQEKSVLLDLLIHHEKKELRLLGEQVAGHRWFFSENSQVNVDSAVVNSRRVLRRVAGGKHWKKYFLSGDVLQLSNLAMPVRKGFCHKHKLQTIVSRVNNGGLLAKVIREEGSKFWARFPELERDENPEEKPLSCYDLIGALIVYLLGISLSLVVFAYELC
ncbi:uncharacterized protein TNCV_4888801 [Trichonephila clavipes]|nr:uncharacterized protein TNCV_4888801 [Trichonephila clavipes]